MKGITLCADCAYYSMKKHKCTRGATDEGEPTARFYADCPLDDVSPVVHGDWIDGRPYVNSRWKVCSVCHQTAPEPHGGYNYCPNCGAKMDGGVDNAAD